MKPQLITPFFASTPINLTIVLSQIVSKKMAPLRTRWRVQHQKHRFAA